MPQRPFAHRGTERKLEAFERYVRAYTQALKCQPFDLVYFDAFAGTGAIPLVDHRAPLLLDVDTILVGSARRALKFADSFSEFVLVEKDEVKARELEQLRVEFPFARIRIECVDANTALAAFCESTNWRKCRAIVFLDPFGNQMDWGTIERIARTKAIDLWYLFPAGLGVNRQIGRDGTIDRSHEATLDRLFGTPDWRREFVGTEAVPDLFETERRQPVKTATPDSITRYMIARMKEVFGGGVLDEWLPLGRSGSHHYSLIFAVANPEPKARALALRLARGVLGSTKRGRRK